MLIPVEELTKILKRTSECEVAGLRSMKQLSCGGGNGPAKISHSSGCFLKITISWGQSRIGNANNNRVLGIVLNYIKIFIIDGYVTDAANYPRLTIITSMGFYFEAMNLLSRSFLYEAKVYQAA